MKTYEATEQAYKNGYAQGKLDAQKHIVQCKDCVSSDTAACPTNRIWCTTLCRYMKEDGFCSHGERKEDGN